MVPAGVVVENVLLVYDWVPPELKKKVESAWPLFPPDATTLIGVAVVGLTATSVKSAPA